MPVSENMVFILKRDLESLLCNIAFITYMSYLLCMCIFVFKIYIYIYILVKQLIFIVYETLKLI